MFLVNFILNHENDHQDNPFLVKSNLETENAYTKYEIQKQIPYSVSSYCLCVLYLSSLVGFINAVLNLYYENVARRNRRKETFIVNKRKKWYLVKEV